jgi:NADH dehydrogenase [ubiquinone] 1 alpha subcomplex assembly factor 7
MAAKTYAERLHRLICNNGPIPLSQYMGESNAHYYNARDPLGEGGDFITAPEVSQMFGEMIGLWCADIWTRAGKPQPVHYVELGPGRATLASDALRAAGAHGFNPQVHFVEGSDSLRALQTKAVPQAVHHADTSSLPDDAPLLIVANEFFDALAVRQLVKTHAGWRERMVGLADEELAFVAGDKPMDAAIGASHKGLETGALETGTIVETCPAASAIMRDLAQRIASQGGAMLAIDYGSLEPRVGSTLQAIRAHRKIAPLEAPGEADLTAHVDFAALSDAATDGGALVSGQASQGDWLKAMGIGARAQALIKNAPDQAATIARQLERLAAPEQMGDLFKVLAIRAPDWPQGAGFDAL